MRSGAEGEHRTGEDRGRSLYPGALNRWAMRRSRDGTGGLTGHQSRTNASTGFPTTPATRARPGRSGDLPPAARGALRALPRAGQSAGRARPIRLWPGRRLSGVKVEREGERAGSAGLPAGLAALPPMSGRWRPGQSPRNAHRAPFRPCQGTRLALRARQCWALTKKSGFANRARCAPGHAASSDAAMAPSNASAKRGIQEAAANDRMPRTISLPGPAGATMGCVTL